MTVGGFFRPTVKELRDGARRKFEQAIAIRRLSPSVSLDNHRRTFLADAVRLQAEAEAMEAEAAELERKGT
jgi:hypothetical protein